MVGRATAEMFAGALAGASRAPLHSHNPAVQCCRIAVRKLLRHKFHHLEGVEVRDLFPMGGGPLSLPACSPQHMLKACLSAQMYTSAQSATPHNIFYIECLSQLSLLSAHTTSVQLSKLHLCVIKISKPWGFH